MRYKLVKEAPINAVFGAYLSCLHATAASTVILGLVLLAVSLAATIMRNVCICIDHILLS